MSANWILFINSGTDDTPTWARVDRSKDAAVPLKKALAEVSRDLIDWETFRGKAKSAELSFGYVYKSGTDADFVALVDSFLNDTPINFAAMDQDIATVGAYGFSGWYIVSEMPLDSPYKDGNIVKIKCALTDEDDTGADRTPGFLEISA